VAYYTGGEWTNLANLCDPVSTDAWERCPSISYDGDTLYFASRRNSDFDDIYFSVKQPTGIGDKVVGPVGFSLTNYPNPFNARTQIHLQLSSLEPVEIGLYDLLGRKVRNIFSGTPRAYDLDFTLDLTSDEYSSGIYFIVAQQGGQRRVIKSTLLK
jgi:hypothetical protein